MPYTLRASEQATNKQASNNRHAMGRRSCWPVCNSVRQFTICPSLPATRLRAAPRRHPPSGPIILQHTFTTTRSPVHLRGIYIPFGYRPLTCSVETPHRSQSPLVQIAKPRVNVNPPVISSPLRTFPVVCSHEFHLEGDAAVRPRPSPRVPKGPTPPNCQRRTTTTIFILHPPTNQPTTTPPNRSRAQRLAPLRYNI